MRIVFCFILYSFFVVACTSDSTDDNTSTSVDCSKIDANSNTYTKSLKAVVDGSCAFSGCHDTRSRAAGVALNDYASVKSSFVNGSSLCSIKHKCGDPMPQGGAKLPQSIIDEFECWVKNGAPQ